MMHTPVDDHHHLWINIPPYSVDRLVAVARHQLTAAGIAPDERSVMRRISRLRGDQVRHAIQGIRWLPVEADVMDQIDRELAARTAREEGSK